MADLIVGGILIVIVSVAITYIVKAKKRGFSASAARQPVSVQVEAKPMGRNVHIAKDIAHSRDEIRRLTSVKKLQHRNLLCCNFFRKI